MKFDVVLRYPDYAAEDWPDEMYIAQNVDAKDYREAIKKARTEAAKAAKRDHPSILAQDFALVLVLPGNTEIFARGDLTY